MDRVIPVVVINDVKDTVPLMQSLREGGINCAEITFRTACAKEAIAEAVSKFPDMNVGAGTVINAEQAKSAVSVGAKFIVSPGFSAQVAKYAKECAVPYYPGCVTPTEIMTALQYGIEIVKFFPANVYGGIKALKALSAPFPQIKFIPTGGIDLSNLAEYLAFDRVFAVGGSFMMKGDVVANCREIRRITK